MNQPQTTDAGAFAGFGLDPSLEQAIAEAGFTEPTPIQERAIPPVMAGRDVLGLAQTGTGKTAAFGLPLMHRLFTAKGRGTRALILAPTRELATQIDAELRMLGKYTPIKTVTIFGGVGANPQIKALRRGPDIIVACPGRLLDLHNQREVDLRGIEYLVLDEADHMFDMGFLPDIRRIIRSLPKERQNLLFSATMPKEIRGLANENLNNPEVVEVDFQGPAKTVKHALYPVANKDKTKLLKSILAKDDVETAIVFTRTKHKAKRLAQQLDRKGFHAAGLQGNMSQNQRDRVMRDFRRGKIRILVATDIVARGIDVADVTHVINYDIPNTAEAYTHRIGRTGRAEQKGEAFTLITAEDRRMVRDIEKVLGHKIERRADHGFATEDEAGPSEIKPSRGGGNRGGGGNRSGGGGNRQRRGGGGRSGSGKGPRDDRRHWTK